MGVKDPRVDAYIAKSAPFAKPILERLRAYVHEACPEVEEQMKWSFPHFIYKGILCSMASFKEHCAFGFWKGALVFDGTDDPSGDRERAMGQFGRIASVADLPAKRVMLGAIRRAVRLNDDGVKSPARSAPRKGKTLDVPAYFLSALRKNRKALATFEAFSFSNKRDYVDWVTEAKTETTRAKRLATAVEWMSEGKIRNWKYARS